MSQTPADRTSELLAMEPAAVMASYRSGAISRRDLGKLFAALGLTTLGRAGPPDWDRLVATAPVVRVPLEK